MLGYLKVVNTWLPNLLNSSPTSGQITYYLRKTLIEGGKIISNNELFQEV